MPRRSPYTKVVKMNQIRAEHVSGMGDVVFKGFQCLDSECLEFIFIRKNENGDDFEIICPSCGIVMLSGDDTKFYEYKLEDKRDNSIIEEGTFTILHDDYIEEAQEYKYCIICNTMNRFLILIDTVQGSQNAKVNVNCVKEFTTQLRTRLD